MVYTPRFFKCSLFHNSNVFGSCTIHILYTGGGKIKKKKFRRQNVKSNSYSYTRVEPDNFVVKKATSGVQ